MLCDTYGLSDQPPRHERSGLAGYRFNDFLRVGVPLTLLMWFSLTVLLDRFYVLR